MNRFDKSLKLILAVSVSLALFTSTGSINAAAGPAPDGPDGNGQKHPKPPGHAGFIKGFDASYVTRVESKGGVYKTSSGEVEDIFKILASWVSFLDNPVH